ncbi:MAG: hypothetical protein GWN86_17865 [Desulfobacterales bacterium]|nr:hypothetical protein [Desulfobacterales bacterium]
MPRIQEAREHGWLVVQDPKEAQFLELVAELSISLGRGESFSIALSKELNADFLLVNDRGAMDEAKKLGIKTKWVSEILHDALAAGLLKDAEEYGGLLEGMRDRGLWITTVKFREAVDKAKKIERERGN